MSGARDCVPNVPGPIEWGSRPVQPRLVASLVLMLLPLLLLAGLLATSEIALPVGLLGSGLILSA